MQEGSQYYPQGLDAVWNAAKQALTGYKIKSSSDATRRLEAEYGMTATTSKMFAIVTARPAASGTGTDLLVEWRLGAWSNLTDWQARRMDSERDQLFERVAAALPSAPLPSPSPSANGLVDELERLADLHRSGALTDDEFAELKRRLIAEARAR